MRAYDLLVSSGYPSMAEATHLVEDRNIAGSLRFSSKDIRRAYKLYGNQPAYVHGKMAKKCKSVVVYQNFMI